MVFFLQVLLNGIATGAIYAVIAEGDSVTVTTVRVRSVGLGLWGMLGVMLAYPLTAVWHVPVVVALVVVLVARGALGVGAERLTVRPFVKAGSEAWVMSTLAIGLLC